MSKFFHCPELLKQKLQLNYILTAKKYHFVFDCQCNNFIPKQPYTDVTKFINNIIQVYSHSESLENDGSFEKDQSSIRLTNQSQIPDLTNKVTFVVESPITKISIGQSHVLVLCENEKVYSYGNNQFGQCGTQNQDPQQATLVQNIQDIVAISSGLYHSICLNKKGQAYCWGRGSEGQLGIGQVECQLEPQQISINTSTHSKQYSQAIKTICCGGSHTLLINDKGEVYSFGDDTWGQLGIGGGSQSRNKPNKLEFFTNDRIRISQVSAGAEHTLFLSEGENKIYACGNNLFSQCGVEGATCLNKPTIVTLPLLQNETITSIYASKETFSAAITSKKQIYIWGTGSWGHARKPTNITNICNFEKECTFENIFMGDNYALIEANKNQILILGQQKLPDLASKQPLQKITCEPLGLSQGSNLQIGYKMMTIVDKDGIVPQSRRFSVLSNEVKKELANPQPNTILKTGNGRTQSVDISCEESTNKEKPSHQSSTISISLERRQIPIPREKEQQKPNIAPNFEVQALKKELEDCKSQIKSKDLLICELQNQILRYQSEKESFSQVQPKDRVEKLEKEPSKTAAALNQERDLLKKQIQQERLQIQQRLELSQAQVFPQTSSMQETRQQTSQFDAKKDQYLQEQEVRVAKLNMTLQSQYLQNEQSQKSDYQSQQEILKQSNVHLAKKFSVSKDPSPMIGGNFKYKSYANFRSQYQDNSQQLQDSQPESRIKKVDEGQFTLTNYNLKSIRSINLYEPRCTTALEVTRPLEKYQTNDKTSGYLNCDLNIERSATPDLQSKPNIEPTHKRTSTLDKIPFQRNSNTPNPAIFETDKKYTINTSIIEKICNYQRIMGNNVNNQAKPPHKPTFMQQEERQYAKQKTEAPTKHSPYGNRFSVCDLSYQDQTGYPSKPQYEMDQKYDFKSSLNMNKQFEDFQKLRG